MIKPYYDNQKNSVFLRGALHPINPETNEAWANEQQALTFIANLPVEVEPLAPPAIVITNVSGTNAIYQNDAIDVDAGVLLTVDIEIQRNGEVITDLNRVFRVPIDRDGQQGVKVLSLEINNGIGQLTTKFDSGEFFINEQTINRRLSDEEFIALPETIHIIVAEANVESEVNAEINTEASTQATVESSSDNKADTSSEATV